MKYLNIIVRVWKMIIKVLPLGLIFLILGFITLVYTSEINVPSLLFIGLGVYLIFANVLKNDKKE